MWFYPAGRLKLSLPRLVRPQRRIITFVSLLETECASKQPTTAVIIWIFCWRESACTAFNYRFYHEYNYFTAAFTLLGINQTLYNTCHARHQLLKGTSTCSWGSWDSNQWPSDYQTTSSAYWAAAAWCVMKQSDIKQSCSGHPSVFLHLISLIISVSVLVSGSDVVWFVVINLLTENLFCVIWGLFGWNVPLIENFNSVILVPS